MPNYSHLTIIGHAGKDPELKYSANGDAICSVSVAVTQKSGREENTTWVRCTAFKKMAETITEYLKKGDPVMFAGTFKVSTWKDKEGNEKQTPELLVNSFQLLKGRGEAKAEEDEPVRSASKFGDLSDDIPFSPLGKYE